MTEKAAVDRLTALLACIDSVRRGGTVSISGVYGGQLDPLPMMQIFDKGIQLRMGQAHVRQWTDEILPLLEGEDDPLGVDDLTTHQLPAGESTGGILDVPEEGRRRDQGRAQAVRVIVTGATGNVGTSVLKALAADPSVDEVVGLARRLPSIDAEKVRWVEADVASSDLHLALRRRRRGDPPGLGDPAESRPGGDGARQRARKRAGLRGGGPGGNPDLDPRLLGRGLLRRAEGPPGRRELADEGIPSSSYSRHKAAVESILDSFEEEHPETRVVRLRPGLIFQSPAASEIRRFFLGPLFPGSSCVRG